MDNVVVLEKFCELLLREVITIKSQLSALIDVLDAFDVVDRDNIDELAEHVREQIEADLIQSEEEEDNETIIGGDPNDRVAPNTCDGS